MTEVVREHTDLQAADQDWLVRLMAEWQILADVSFADLVLWVPDRAGVGFWAAAHVRPTTGPTAIVDEVVETFVAAAEDPRLRMAFHRGLISRVGDPEWHDGVPVRVEAIPVRRAGRVIAVVGRNTNLQGVRTPSRLELAYLETAGELTRMIAAGDFPHPADQGDRADLPRVGDGFIRIEADGVVTYTSPNALSVYRRLGLNGDLVGLTLAAATRDLVPASRRPDEETLSAVLGGSVSGGTELGNQAATVAFRAIPLSLEGSHRGAAVLVRDVTELRRRDRELVTKDATIREIHHRVKNNLQTVAALLRLQSRRLRDNEAARFALDEAVRRVGAIAVVHEVLSQSHEENVPFDETADQLSRLVVDVGTRQGPVTVRREGHFGSLPSEVATSLAMVLTELLQNAVEHATPSGDSGTVRIIASRAAQVLEVTVADDGIGWPPDVDPASGDSLGLSIVRTLVEELGGRLSMRNGAAGGAEVQLSIPLG